MADSNQERAWVLGAYTTLVAIVASCVLGSVFSSIKAEAIFAFGAIICASVINTLTNKLAAIKAENAAVAVQLSAAKVADKVETATAQEKIDEVVSIAKATQMIGEKVHILVNSNMAKALKSVAIALRTIATYKPTPENVKAAEDAEATFTEHEEKQRLVDESGVGPTITMTEIPVQTT